MSADLRLRLATDDDMEWFYDLAMLPDVRAGSVRSDTFSLAQHREWWARRAHESSTHIYVGEVRGKRIGHVRFGRSGADAEVAISVVPAQRRKGYARALLIEGEPLAREALGVERFVALVLLENRASQRLFESCGYRLAGWESRMGRQVRRYEK